MNDVSMLFNGRQKLLALLDRAEEAALNAAGEGLLSLVKENTAVDTGATRDSWKTDMEENMIHVGSDHDNTLYEEFGTGEYAVGGRQGGWVYHSEKGFFFTRGKPPRRPLTRAWENSVGRMLSTLEEIIKEAFS